MHIKVWFNILECILPGNHSKQRQSTVKKQDDAEYLLDAVYCIHFYHLSVQLYPSYKKKKLEHIWCVYLVLFCITEIKTAGTEHF